MHATNLSPTFIKINGDATSCNRVLEKKKKVEMRKTHVELTSMIKINVVIWRERRLMEGKIWGIHETERKPHEKMSIGVLNFLRWTQMWRWKFAVRNEKKYEWKPVWVEVCVLKSHKCQANVKIRCNSIFVIKKSVGKFTSRSIYGLSQVKTQCGVIKLNEIQLDFQWVFD
jgi:hypothetical protein